MKVIDLLNKIANGENVPKHIHIRDVDNYTWQEDVKAYWSDKDENNLLFDLDLSSTNLTEDIEILEEKKKIPEKLNNGYTKEAIEDMKNARFNSNDMEKICNRIGWLMQNRNDLSDKIDEIIDYIKSKGE